MIRFQCPACSATMTAPDGEAGRKGECPTCGQRLQIPSAAPPPQPVRAVGEAGWYYARGGSRSGPCTPAQLRQLASAGQLLPADMLWKEGMAEWAAAGSIKGLFPATISTPAIPPPLPGGPPPAAGSSGQARGDAGATAGEVRRPARPWVAGVVGFLIAVWLWAVATVLFKGGPGGGGEEDGGRPSVKAVEPATQAREVGAAGMTKAEFYARLKTFKDAQGPTWQEGRNNALWFMRKSDFDDNFGPPSRTQTRGELVYWYWDVRDGTIQVVVKPAAQVVAPKGFFPLYAVNDN